MTFDAIFITDTSQKPFWLRGHGAHQLASLLREHGYTCLVLDFASVLTQEVWKIICQTTIGTNTRFIGISTTWMPYRVNGISFTDLSQKDATNKRGNDTFVDALVNNNIHPWINFAKQINPKIKFIAGGPKIDFYMDLPFDNVFAGFSETQLLDFMQDTKRIWPRVVQHDVNAQNLKVWDFKKSVVKYTELDQIESQEMLVLEVARGCRFKCAFCSFPLIGRKDFAANAKCSEILFAELNENYQRWGVTSYHIGDDTFNDNTDKLRLIQSVTSRLPFKLSLTAYTRIDMIANQPEQIQILHDIGLKSTWMGVDSLHPIAAKTIGKGMRADKVKKALCDAKKVWQDDVYVKIGYIAGLPGEGTKELEDNVRWLVESSIDALLVNPLRLIRPGIYPHFSRSDMDKNHGKYGYYFQGEANYTEWTKNDGTDIMSFRQAVEVSKRMNELVDFQNKKIYNDPLRRSGIKSPQNYYNNLVQMLQHL
jgi:radical SAM superfamily enzyme YgiQ (UPF0313 family)